MLGHIVSVNTNSGTGLLQADTGGQWRFRAQEWRGQGVPAVGQAISFRVADNEAIEVVPSAAQGGFGTAWGNNAGNVMQGIADPFGPPAARQTFWSFYFSPSGRVSLGQYWFHYLMPCGVLALIAIAAVIYVIFYALHHHIAMPVLLTIGGLLVFKFCVLGWVSFVMHVKRMHDLNMSWATGYVVDNFMPFGRDWMLFRMLCQHGTPGPNNFGDDPR